MQGYAPSPADFFPPFLPPFPILFILLWLFSFCPEMAVQDPYFIELTYSTERK